MMFSATYRVMLFATYCGIVIAISALTVPLAVTEHTPRLALDLPQGFRPQEPPMQPLLYPFITSAPSGSSDWKPIAGHTDTPAPPATPSTETQHISANTPNTSERITASREPGVILESIVYGAWKSNPPLEPDKLYKPTTSAAKRKISVPHEQLRPQYHTADSSASSTFLPKSDYQHANTPTIQSTESNFDIVSVDISDPTLLALAKQINDSVESTPVPPSRNLNTSTSLPAFDSTEATVDDDVSKVWPTDFTVSNESDADLSSSQRSSFHSTGNGSDPRPMLSNLRIPNSLLTQTPFNITKVGVPYENHNSAEEPTICVPLTVQEQVNSAEVIDVERVYCFPLPQTEVEANKAQENNSSRAKVQSVTEYEAANVANRHFNCVNLKMVCLSAMCIGGFYRYYGTF